MAHVVLEKRALVVPATAENVRRAVEMGLVPTMNLNRTANWIVVTLRSVVIKLATEKKIPRTVRRIAANHPPVVITSAMELKHVIPVNAIVGLVLKNSVMAVVAKQALVKHAPLAQVTVAFVRRHSVMAVAARKVLVKHVLRVLMIAEHVLLQL